MKPSPRALLVLVALAAVLAAPGTLARAEEPKLPPGVVARVHGEDITEEQLLERLVRRHGDTERGREILDQVVDDAMVGAEAARRGITVTDAEARAYAEKVAETVKDQRWGGKTLEQVLEESGTTYPEFLRTTKEYLLRERMARQDLGTKDEGEVPEHRLKLWVADLRRKSGVRYEGLPDGVVAQVGSTPIDRARFARELRARIGLRAVNEARADLVLEAAMRHQLRSAGVTVADEDVDAQIARIRESFEKTARVTDDATWEQFLRKRFGTDQAGLRKDANFRAQVGLEKLLGKDITDEQVRRHWEQNALAYGERALVRQVFIPATDTRTPGFGADLPTFREAQDLALRARVEILEQAGAAGDPAARKPLAEVVTAVAKRYETAADRRDAAGQPAVWTHVDTKDHAALDQAVFTGAVGTLVGPVKSGLGYHVLLVEERRPAPSYEEVQPKVRKELLGAAVRAFHLRLRTGEDIVVPDLK